MSNPASPDMLTTLSTPLGQPADATAVTITVQITVPNDVLPMAAHRLIDDLRALTETAAELSARRPSTEPANVDGPAQAQAVGVRSPQPAGVPGPVPPRRPVDGPLPRPVPAGAARAGRTVLHLETGSRTVRLDGLPVHLSRREYDLLSYLCRNPRRVFSRAQLLRSVWGYEMVGGERTVDVHVRRLRAKLGTCSDGIVTVRGVGYRFDDQSSVALVLRGD